MLLQLPLYLTFLASHQLLTRSAGSYCLTRHKSTLQDVTHPSPHVPSLSRYMLLNQAILHTLMSWMMILVLYLTLLLSWQEGLLSRNWYGQNQQENILCRGKRRKEDGGGFLTLRKLVIKNAMEILPLKRRPTPPLQQDEKQEALKELYKKCSIHNNLISKQMHWYNFLFT